MMGKKYYTITYYISVTYLGILVNFFLFGIYFRILENIIVLNKSISIFIVVICPIFISIYGLIKAKIIFVDNIIIKIKKYKSKNPTKICHLSDIHLGAIYQKNFCQKIINIINNKIKPDIVVITGDLMDSSLKPNIQSLKPFDQIKVPILYITGNHEETIGKEEVLEVLKKLKLFILVILKVLFFLMELIFLELIMIIIL
jgi:predicted MPP superfamily phosphohydrolase